MQRLPRLTACSGLPSSLTARPSRVRTVMPQPAGHSRQVVAYHVATPGTSSSGGMTYGMIRSGGTDEQALAATAGAAAPSIFRNVRRPTVSNSGSLMQRVWSVVTHEAIGGRAALLVAAETP